MTINIQLFTNLFDDFLQKAFENFPFFCSLSAKSIQQQVKRTIFLILLSIPIPSESSKH